MLILVCEYVKKNILILTTCISWSGLINCNLGTDGSWDLYAYHYYNGYAALNNRVGFDILPASLQTYFNPILDIINYSILNLPVNKYIILFILGSFWGLLPYVLYLISDLIFSKTIVDKKIKNILVFFSVLIGSTECVIFSEIGMSQGDVIIAVLVLSSVY